MSYQHGKPLGQPMDYSSDGTNIASPVTKTDLETIVNPLDRTKLASVWGHTIDVRGDSINCTTCDMEESVPDIFLESAGFNELVYRLYIYGKFRETSCEPSDELRRVDRVGDDPSDNIQPHGNTYWSGTTTITLRNGDIVTDGTLVYSSDNPDYRSGDRLTDKDRERLFGPDPLPEPTLTVDGDDLSDEQEKTLREKLSGYASTIRDRKI